MATFFVGVFKRYSKKSEAMLAKSHVCSVKMGPRAGLQSCRCDDSPVSAQQSRIATWHCTVSQNDYMAHRKRIQRA
jgi:hypothetical protein